QQPQQQQQISYRQSPRHGQAGLNQSFDAAAAAAASPRVVIDESTLNRQFKYTGTRLAGSMSRSPPGKYNQPLPPISGPGAGAKKIDSRELDKTIIAASSGDSNRDKSAATSKTVNTTATATAATNSTIAEDRTVTELQFDASNTDFSATDYSNSEEVGGYSTKFQQAATSPGYTPYNVSDFQNLKSVATLGGLGHDKENDGYRISIRPEVDLKTGQTLSEVELQAKREAQEKRSRMKAYSKNLQQKKPVGKPAAQQKQQPKQQQQQPGQKASVDVNKLLHDPELDRQMQRHLEDKKRSDSIRQQVAAT
uniref:CG32790 n=1 Tax=Macrostomum lignano TaxID=282301 RepID=A0A1I8GNN1_9PLAT